MCYLNFLLSEISRAATKGQGVGAIWKWWPAFTREAHSSRTRICPRGKFLLIRMRQILPSATECTGDQCRASSRRCPVPGGWLRVARVTDVLPIMQGNRSRVEVTRTEMRTLVTQPCTWMVAVGCIWKTTSHTPFRLKCPCTLYPPTGAMAPPYARLGTVA